MACSFPFLQCFCLILVSVWCSLHRMSWEVFLLLFSGEFEKDWCYFLWWLLEVEHRLYVCRLQEWEHTGWVVKVTGSKACAQKLLCMGLIVPCHVGSFWTRDWTCVLCIDRQILNYVTTREVPKFCFLIFLYLSFLHFILCSNLYCIFLSATFVFSSSFSCSLNCKFVILRCLLICFCVSQLVGF